MATDIFLQPDPETGWSRDCVTAKPALVVPPSEGSMVQETGVYGPDGWIHGSATWRAGKLMMTEPAVRPEPAARLAGRHLWAGQLWTHFGHFLCESLARLWGAARAQGAESLIFVPKRPRKADEVKDYQARLIRLLGIDLPIRVLTDPTEVEELVIPGQGFGLGEMAVATPEFRDFVHLGFARDIRPDGPPRLYLSRSALGGEQGGALLETVLEQNLARDGYEIFHPQQHPVEVQIARYRAATHVVGLDGSAFHLFGFVARPQQQVAILVRRTLTVYRSIVIQLESFTGRIPRVIQAIEADWVHEQRGTPGRSSFGQLDFARIAAELGALDFIAHGADWTIPTRRDFRLEIQRIARSRNAAFTRQALGVRPLSVGPRPTTDAA